MFPLVRVVGSACSLSELRLGQTFQKPCPSHALPMHGKTILRLKWWKAYVTVPRLFLSNRFMFYRQCPWNRSKALKTTQTCMPGSKSLSRSAVWFSVVLFMPLCGCFAKAHKVSRNGDCEKCNRHPLKYPRRGFKKVVTCYM